jgi:hypothetical protein
MSLPAYTDRDNDAGIIGEKEALLPTMNDTGSKQMDNSIEELKSAAPAYIPSFEGLRGLSVLAVQISHALPIHMRGTHRTFGAIGMSVFFIMSGYLVTGSLMGQQVSQYTV